MELKENLLAKMNTKYLSSLLINNICCTGILFSLLWLAWMGTIPETTYTICATAIYTIYLYYSGYQAKLYLRFEP